ncbi:MAG TPA: hypothetical protein VFD27_12975 [Chthoniobacteraceae bacterium]|jgi:hypothetical protein|nr:hypothetical protein [Chthoniobacteraceae bacterium]
MTLRSLASTFAALCASVFTASAAFLWIEGEEPTTSTVQKHGWYNSVKKEVLSGNDWLSHYGDKPGEAAYQVEVPEAGGYTLWARVNPVASEPKWKVDGAEWQAVTLGTVQQQQNIASDGKIDHRFIGWVKIGALQLAKGKHKVAFRFEGPVANSGGLDCFVLTTEKFVPQGTRKPSETSASAAPSGPGDWFPLLPEDDTFDARSVIDMSRLVPAPAGQFGLLNAVGKDLKFEKAPSPVKLWGVGANVSPGHYSREQLTQRAKYLRKFGVNVVRQHPLFDELSSNGKIDPKKLDEYDWWFAELKKHGIYTDWSIFYHFQLRRDAGYPLFDDLEGRGDVRDTYGVITGAPKLWEIRNKTLVALLDHKNPYTGLRYADDPALAIVEMQNEDSIFFWNPLGELANPAPKKWPAHAKQLREMFATWVKTKYKADDALKTAWGALKSGESVNANELRIMSPWELDGKGPRGEFAGQTRRAGDCIEFLSEMQRAEFETCAQAIRGTGFKAITMTTAWQVGGAATEAANIWTDTVGDMIDRHNYAGGGAGGHGVAEGKVNNQSHLAAPGGGIFTIGMRQVEDKPFCVTEWTQSAPNQWKIEATPIMAFYGLGLQGWDASFHFIQSGTRLGDGWPSMSSYATDTPAYIGQFPALAFALHHGHITKSPIIAARRLSKADLVTGTDALKQDATKGGYDAKTMIVNGGTPLEAFAIGGVTVGFDGGKTEQADFSKYWDTQNKIVKSATSELVWDYGRQLITVQTPKTQAIIGRPGDQAVRLPGVSASFKTPFVSVIFTPLDDLPLAQSIHILITALAQDKQTGTRYNADGTLLEATGTAPLLLEPVQAVLKFTGAKPAQVNALDHYGVPTGKSVPISADGSIAIDGTYQAYYYEVKR